jgi:hypothetical protein
LRIFEANPTAIPLEPFMRTVGTMGKKYSGSIISPSSSLCFNNSKSLYISLKLLDSLVPIYLDAPAFGDLKLPNCPSSSNSDALFLKCCATVIIEFSRL